MTSRSRANVVSSFTIIKGAMIAETYAVFAGWDFERSKRENLDHLRADNFIGALSAAWLRDVAKVLNRRFDPEGRDRALVLLAKNRCELAEWKPILLWHITRDEFLLRDFLQNWLFPAYESGAFRVRPEDVCHYLQSLRKRGGVTEHEWTETTLKRVAAGLLTMAVDFELLRGAVLTHTVIFDVSTDRGIRSGNQMLTEIMYRLFLESLGYARDIDLAELEIVLEGEGRLDGFKKPSSAKNEIARSDIQHLQLAGRPMEANGVAVLSGQTRVLLGRGCAAVPMKTRCMAIPPSKLMEGFSSASRDVSS